MKRNYHSGCKQANKAYTRAVFHIDVAFLANAVKALYSDKNDKYLFLGIVGKGRRLYLCGQKQMN